MGEHRRRKDDLICSPLRRVVEIATSAAAGVVMMHFAMLLTINTRRTMHGPMVNIVMGILTPWLGNQTVPLKFRRILHSSRFSSP